MLTAIDLFCGAGGMSLGLKNAGFDIVAALDNWEPAVRTYQHNFGHPILAKDIRTVSDKQLRNAVKNAAHSVDLIVGAPPFQAPSFKNTKSIKDDKTGLIFEFARCVRSLLPRMFLMEIGASFTGIKGGNFSDLFMRKLSEVGYSVEWREVNAAEYGVPQMRKRLFCYGWLEVPSFSFPAPDHAPGEFRTVRDAIGDLPSPPDDYTSFPGDPLHRRMKMSETNLERLRHIPPGGSYKDVPDSLRPERYNIYGPGRVMHREVYGRLEPDKPADNIHAGFDSFTRGKFAHPFEDRNITLREGARLQTFPDDFVFVAKNQRDTATMIGNATPPLLAEKLGRAIAYYLLGKTRSVSRRRPSGPSNTRKRKQNVWFLPFKGTLNILPEVSPPLKQFLESDGKAATEMIKLLSGKDAKGSPAIQKTTNAARYHELVRMYRAVGLLYEKKDSEGVRRLKVTPLGHFVRRWLDTLNKANRDLFARYVASALAVCQLRNPADNHDYDDSMRVFPFTFIWRAMLALDGRINSAELAGAIFKVRNEDDLDDAVEKIAEARRKNNVSILGKPVKADGGTIATWMAMASFGWIFMTDRNDSEKSGYWEVREQMVEVLDAALGVTHKHREFESSDGHAVDKYMKQISRAAALPEDRR
jgi:DNA (cytosine-5)-methyltransferase 1